MQGTNWNQTSFSSAEKEHNMQDIKKNKKLFWFLSKIHELLTLVTYHPMRYLQNLLMFDLFWTTKHCILSLPPPIIPLSSNNMRPNASTVKTKMNTCLEKFRRQANYFQLLICMRQNNHLYTSHRIVFEFPWCILFFFPLAINHCFSFKWIVQLTVS